MGAAEHGAAAANPRVNECSYRKTATVDDTQVRPAPGQSDHLGGKIFLPTNVWEPGARLSSGPERSTARKQAGYSSAVDPVCVSDTVAKAGKSL